jgi:hypothetical protein
MNIVRTLFTIVLLVAAIAQAYASVPLGANRKGVGGSYDMYGCMHTNDYYVVNFAAYQLGPNQTLDPKNLPVAECTDIPNTGKTQISIDLLDLDVRKKNVALKILREDGQAIAVLPMARAKQGVLSLTADFTSPGKYQAVVSVDDTDLHTQSDISALHIPLTVALASEQTGGSRGLWILLAIVGVVVLASAYYVPRLLAPQANES